MTTRQWLLVGAILLGLCQLALGMQTLGVVYGGEETLPSNVRIGDWGAIPREETENLFKPQVVPGSATRGLRVTTLGRYQGMRIDLRQPLQTTDIFGEKNRFLEVHLRAAANIDGVPNVGSLRFTLYTDQGIAFLSMKEEDFYPKDNVGVWTRIGIPLSRLTPVLPAGAQIHRIVVTTDTPADFYLGHLAFVHDNTPLSLNPSVIPSPVVVGRRINFRSGVASGLTPHKTTWNFDSMGGSSIDAVGDSVTHTFQYLSTYRVVVTVTDPSGWKEPQSTTITVRVNKK